MIHVGITGTRQGATSAQLEELGRRLAIGASDEHRFFHHGDAVGVDQEGDHLARQAGYTIVVHPPENDKHRVWCGLDDSGSEEDGYIIYEPKDYFARNEDIVNASDVLLGFPKKMYEEQRSGTWHAIRYARKVGKPIVIVYPDGSVGD